jgi:predicted nucleic acid-binding protein
LGLGNLTAFLRQHHRVALDTNIFIYELEENPRYLALTRHIFRWLEEPHHAAVTSTLTMTEVLTGFYLRKEPQRAHQNYALLSIYPRLEWMAPDLKTADLAAQFRAHHRMRIPDAIQAATAVLSGATGLISNDPVFRRVEAFETMVLDDLL